MRPVRPCGTLPTCSRFDPGTVIRSPKCISVRGSPERTLSWYHTSRRNTAHAGAFGWPSEHMRTEGPLPRNGAEIRIAQLRAKTFFAFAMALAIPMFFVMVILYPAVMVLDRCRRRAEHHANRIWATLSTLPFIQVKMEGLDNMPAADCPAVFVANHESFMDIFSLLHLDKDFKFVSKRSIFGIPFVGWSMWLTGHIALDRQDAAGFRTFVRQGREILKNGSSLAIFPEGTRSADGRLGAFKKGAFTIATKAHVTLIPITILGSGDIMPREGELHPGAIRVIVHPAVNTSGKKTARVADECRDVIASRLPRWKIVSASM